MTTCWLIFVVFMAICLIAVLIMIWRAPDGYEDEKGFHQGKPEGPNCCQEAVKKGL